MTAPTITAEETTAEATPAWWTHLSVDGTVLFLGGLMLAGLAIITGIISYQHGLDVARTAGAAGIVAYLIPLVADLLIAASSLSILDANRHGRSRPLFAWLSLAVGIVVTVVMNVAAAWSHGWGPRLLNAVAPVALILSYETLMSMIRHHRARAVGEAEPGQPEVAVGQCPHLPALVPEDAAVTAFLHARDCDGTRPTLRSHAESWGIHRNRLSELVKQADEPQAAEPVRELVLNGSAAGA